MRALAFPVIFMIFLWAQAADVAFIVEELSTGLEACDGGVYVRDAKRAPRCSPRPCHLGHSITCMAESDTTAVTSMDHVVTLATRGGDTKSIVGWMNGCFNMDGNVERSIEIVCDERGMPSKNIYNGYNCEAAIFHSTPVISMGRVSGSTFSTTCSIAP